MRTKMTMNAFVLATVFSAQLLQAQIATKAVRQEYDPLLDPENQRASVSRNGDMEWVYVDGNCYVSKQWSGATRDEDERSLNLTANTIQLNASRTYSVQLKSWLIEEGSPVKPNTKKADCECDEETAGDRDKELNEKGKRNDPKSNNKPLIPKLKGLRDRKCKKHACGTEYEFQPQLQQDAHLRFGYMGTSNVLMNVADGQGFSLNTVYPQDAVIVNLSFYSSAGGTSEWRIASNDATQVQCGIWQVHAGETLLEAQSNEANRLAPAAFLQGTTPDTPMTFLFRLNAIGQWALNVDLLESTNDVYWTSGTYVEGCKPAAGVNVSADGGLIISTIAAEVSEWPKVGRTFMELDLSPTEAVVQISPRSGYFPLAHTTDVSIMWIGDQASGSVYLDGRFISFDGAFEGTYGTVKYRRLPQIKMERLEPGRHEIKAKFIMKDGSLVNDSVVWTVLDSSEIKPIP